MAKTYDADSGADVTGNAVPLTPVSSNGSMASIINIPPQIAVTLVWVALGFAIGVYVSHMWTKKSA